MELKKQRCSLKMLVVAAAAGRVVLVAARNKAVLVDDKAKENMLLCVVVVCTVCGLHCLYQKSVQKTVCLFERYVYERIK